MESWDFLNRLGLNLDEESLPMISKLNVTSPSGKMISHKLDSGGFGISRFKLDELLAEKVRSNGVVLKTNFSISEVKH